MFQRSRRFRDLCRYLNEHSEILKLEVALDVIDSLEELVKLPYERRRLDNLICIVYLENSDTFPRFNAILPSELSDANHPQRIEFLDALEKSENRAALLPDMAEWNNLYTEASHRVKEAYDLEGLTVRLYRLVLLAVTPVRVAEYEHLIEQACYSFGLESDYFGD